MSSMIDEHFGINVVEMMVAYLFPSEGAVYIPDGCLISSL